MENKNKIEIEIKYIGRHVIEVCNFERFNKITQKKNFRETPC